MSIETLIRRVDELQSGLGGSPGWIRAETNPRTTRLLVFVGDPATGLTSYYGGGGANPQLLLQRTYDTGRLGLDFTGSLTFGEYAEVRVYGGALTETSDPKLSAVRAELTAKWAVP